MISESMLLFNIDEGTYLDHMLIVQTPEKELLLSRKVEAGQGMIGLAPMSFAQTAARTRERASANSSCCTVVEKKQFIQVIICVLFVHTYIPCLHQRPCLPGVNY